MTELGVGRTTVLEGYRRFGDLAATLSEADLDRPTRLRDWSVRQLLAHVAWGQAMEVDAVRRRDADQPGCGEAPPVSAGASRSELVAAVRTGYERLRTALSSPVEAEQTLISVPAGTLPAGVAVALFALEAGLHAADLAHAIGEPDRLTAGEVAACLALADPMLDLGTAFGTVPTGPVVVEIRGDGVTLLRAWRDGGWQQGTEDPSDTVITGTDEAVALFVYGRGSWRDLGLEVTGDPRAADLFKEWFPGP